MMIKIAFIVSIFSFVYCFIDFFLLGKAAEVLGEIMSDIKAIYKELSNISQKTNNIRMIKQFEPKKLKNKV